MSLTLLLSAGNALVKCGQAQLRIGNAEREFIQTTSNNFLQPLHNFLEGDMKTIQVSRGLGGGWGGWGRGDLLSDLNLPHCLHSN